LFYLAVFLSGSFRCSVFNLAASAAELLSPLLSFYFRCRVSILRGQE
jgi:hypothetical protein